jgi:taurine--2-oxoglutarate transaminase
MAGVALLYQSAQGANMMTPDPVRGQEVYDLDRAHVFHSWSAQGALKPMVFAGGEGSYVWDYEGNRFIDF